MMKIYRTQEKQLTRATDFTEGVWISMTAPTQEEVREVATGLDIEPADILAPMDPEESARISLEDGYTLIIVDIPVLVDGAYSTVPLGILLTQELIVTVCSVETPVLGDFAACRVRGFSTRKKMRFVYQILYRAATLYQQELRLIDRRRQAIEKNMTGTLRDSDLMELHGMESSLVYFATSLRANTTVLDRLTRYKRL
ncbi:MAG: magnesium transporter CorA family protein, partial [Gemmiger sp.]